MKSSFFALIFILFGKLLFAKDCEPQLGFAAKSNSWKAVNATVSNGIIYIDINSETDSLSFKLLKSIDCNNLAEITTCFFEGEQIDLSKEGVTIKTNSTGGLYKLLITTPGTSEWYKIFVRVTKPTSQNNLFVNTNFVIYPNPAKDIFYIENTSQVEKIKIIDIIGSELLTFDNTFRKDALDIDISKLPAGQYFVTFINDKQKLTKKLVKL